MQGHYTPFGVRMSYRCRLSVFGSSLPFASYVIFSAGCCPFPFTHCFHLRHHQASCTEKTAATQQQKGVTPAHRFCNSLCEPHGGRYATRLQKRRPWRALEKSLASESWNESEEERVQYFHFPYLRYQLFSFSLFSLFPSLFSFPYFSSYV